MKLRQAVLNGTAIVTLFVLCSGLSWSANRWLPQFVAARVTAPPVMDGKLDDPAWSKAVETSGFAVLGAPDKSPRVQTYVKALSDGKALYLGFRCEEPRMSEVKTKFVPHDGEVYLQENVDVVIDPSGDGTDCYHLISNLSGGQHDAHIKMANTGAADEDMKWNGDWTAKGSRGENEWYCEMRIPFSTIGADLSKNSMFRISLSRVSWLDTLENSCWAPIQMRFIEPWNMGELIIADEDGSYVQVRFPRLKSISTGVHEIPMEIANRDKSAIKPVVSFKLSGDKTATGEVVLNEVAAGKDTETAIPLSVDEPGQYSMQVTVSDSITGKKIYSANRAMDVTNAITFDEALYRLYHKKAEAVVEARVPYDGAKLKVSLCKEGSDTPVAVKTFSSLPGGRVNVSFNMKKMSAGVYVMRGELIRGGKIAAASPSRKFNYNPNPKYGFNKDGFMLVDGKPFFPVGIYSLRGPVGNIEGAMVDGAKAGFNTTVFYDMDPTKLMPLLDLCQKNGIKAFVYPTVPFSVRTTKVTDDMVRHDLDVRKNHPALLGWYVVDEPEGIGLAPVAPVRHLYQVIKDHDTEHPCALVVMGADAAGNYQSSTDIMWIDSYPIRKVPITEVSDKVSGAIASIAKDKPLWCVPQAFDWDVWDFGKIRDGIHRPTNDEERCMTYMSLVNGSKGVIFWAYTSSRYNIYDHPEYWAYVKKMAGEIRDLTPVLTTPTIGDKLVVSPKNPAIQTMVKKVKGEWTVLTVNSSDKACDISFGLPDLKDGSKINVLFEGRSLQVENGTWKDSFKPLEAHVYRLSAH